MKKTNKLGFTLIELLVVITIIGILATGATSIYTSQIQKARDSTRLNDVKALQSSVEQAYQDGQEYPKTTASSFSGAVSQYIDKFPVDPKFLKPGNKTGEGTDSKKPTLGYVYNVGADDNGIDLSIYEISTAFEANGNITGKAKLDNGNDDNRLEIGMTTKGLKTSAKDGSTCTTDNTNSTLALMIGENNLCGVTATNQY